MAQFLFYFQLKFLGSCTVRHWAFNSGYSTEEEAGSIRRWDFKIPSAKCTQAHLVIAFYLQNKFLSLGSEAIN